MAKLTRHLSAEESFEAIGREWFEIQMNIPQDKLKAAPIPLCPENEQYRIVQKVDELMALCDQLKESQNQASEIRCQLTEAVVKKGAST